jgi:WD repeat-containing protein 34
MSGRGDFSLPGIDLQATAMSWNATGSVLAVAFGRHDESGWCNITKAGCGLYHVFSRDFDPARPQTMLDTTSYLMSVACHPEMPGIIAGGTFNGEVVIWDTAREESGEQQIACSTIDDYFHREPVVSVSWIYDAGEQCWNLASVSGEGKVLFWTLKNSLATPMYGHLLAVKAKGKSARVVAGGAAMSFQTGGKHSSSFVVGAESGMLFRCNMRQSRKRVTPPADAADMWSPEAWALLSRARSADRDGAYVCCVCVCVCVCV